MDDQQKIEEIYQEFISKLDNLQKEQEALIRKYRQRLEEKRLMDIKNELIEK